MGFKFLSFIFAYLAAGAFSRFLGQLEPSSQLIQGLVICYILCGFTLSFALWTRRKWVLSAFIVWSVTAIFFMFALQRGKMQMPWADFTGSLAIILVVQILLGFYIKRTMDIERDSKSSSDD